MKASYKKLFEIMKTRNLNSKELAETAGISTATVSKLKKDGAKVSSDILVKICISLDCTMNDIIDIIPTEDASNFI